MKIVIGSLIALCADTGEPAVQQGREDDPRDRRMGGRAVEPSQGAAPDWAPAIRHGLPMAAVSR